MSRPRTSSLFFSFTPRLQPGDQAQIKQLTVLTVFFALREHLFAGRQIRASNLSLSILEQPERETVETVPQLGLDFYHRAKAAV
jgi:hypothetical protein